MILSPDFVNLVHPDMIHPAAHVLHEKTFRRAKLRQLRINVWPVNNLPAMEWLLERGVAGLISDFPSFMLSAVGKATVHQVSAL